MYIYKNVKLFFVLHNLIEIFIQFKIKREYEILNLNIDYLSRKRFF